MSSSPLNEEKRAPNSIDIYRQGLEENIGSINGHY